MKYGPGIVCVNILDDLLCLDNFQLFGHFLVDSDLFLQFFLQLLDPLLERFLLLYQLHLPVLPFELLFTQKLHHTLHRVRVVVVIVVVL